MRLSVITDITCNAAATASPLWQWIAVGVILAAVVAILLRRIIRAIRHRNDPDAPLTCSGCALADTCRRRGPDDSCPPPPRKSSGCSCGCH